MDEDDARGVTRQLFAGRLDEDLRWLAPGLLAGVAVAGAYLLTHPYPAYGAGLYFLMAERVADAGYALAETIPYYTREGVPFAYPPLLFYVLAVVGELSGADAIFVSRHLPAVFTVAYLVAFYALARRLRYPQPQAGVATFLLSIFPPVLQWHLSAGGVVRAGAFLLALAGCYAGCRLFQDGDDRWLVVTAILTGATAMAHPLYLVFLVVSLTALYVGFDRSAAGLVRGGAVGLGGLVVAAPWWTTVVTTHGWEVFVAAAGTHGGIGDIVTTLLVDSSESPAAAALDRPYLHVPALLAVAYLAHRRRLLLPGWFAAVGFTVGKPRLLFFFAALFGTALLFDPVLPWLRRVEPARRHSAVVAVLVVVALLGTAGGVLYATGQLEDHTSSQSLPTFIDDEDRDAMDWVRENTAEDAGFVVVGDAAEWFPYFARRPILVSPWGVEWVDPEQYQRHLELYKHLSQCERATCVTVALDRTNVEPEYLYVPTDSYTVRGKGQDGGRLADSLESSDRYREVYRNDGVVIVRFVR